MSDMRKLLHILGFVINEDKSQLEPMHWIGYLGFLIDSLAMMISLPEEKVTYIQQECLLASQQQSIPLRGLYPAGMLVSLTATKHSTERPISSRNAC